MQHGKTSCRIWELSFQIAYDLPGTAVMNNDDFKDGTLTGAWDVLIGPMLCLWSQKIRHGLI